MAANGKDGGKVAVDLEKMIHEARDRKKNEALAAKIFGKDRTPATSRPSPKLANAATSLASRAGVKKQRAEAPSHGRHSTGNIDGEWKHDLHESQSRGPKANGKASGSGAGSLAARITDPNAPAPKTRQRRRAAQVAQALIRSELESDPEAGKQQPQQQQPQQQQRQQHQPTSFNGNPPTAPKAMIAAQNTFNKGITIRGLAGPFVVMAQNFAPGTTAADIESAMTPVGGIVTSCRVIKHHPIVIAEIIFESKEGADNVIATFNNQTADGRVLNVYHKIGNTPSASTTAQTSTRLSDNHIVLDGSYGFDDPMDTTSDSTAKTANAGAGSGLYSDNLVKTNRWGRGFSSGAGRFGGR